MLTPLFYSEPEVAASMAGLPVLAATTTGGVSGSYQPGGATGMTIDELFAPLRATTRKCGWLWQTPFALHDVRNLDDAALLRAGEDYKSVILSTPVLNQKLASKESVVIHSVL